MSLSEKALVSTTHRHKDPVEQLWCQPHTATRTQWNSCGVNHTPPQGPSGTAVVSTTHRHKDPVEQLWCQPHTALRAQWNSCGVNHTPPRGPSGTAVVSTTSPQGPKALVSTTHRPKDPVEQLWCQPHHLKDPKLWCQPHTATRTQWNSCGVNHTPPRGPSGTAVVSTTHHHEDPVEQLWCQPHTASRTQSSGVNHTSP